MAQAMEHLANNWPHYVNAILQLSIFLHQTVPGADFIEGDVPPLIQLGLGLASVGTGGYLNHMNPLRPGGMFSKGETLKEHWTPEASVANVVYALSLMNVIFAILGLSGVKGVRNANNRSSKARRGGKARRSRRSRSQSRRRRRNKH